MNSQDGQSGPASDRSGASCAAPQASVALPPGHPDAPCAGEHPAREGDELRPGERYARSLIEASLDPLVTISAEGKITDVNKATEKITGVSREILIGSDFSEYFTEPAMARAGYRKVFEQGQVVDYPLAIRHASGAVADVIYNASVYKDESGQVLVVFAAARDVTGLNRAEAKRHETEAHFLRSNQILTSILEHTDIMAVFMDPRFNFIWVNRSYAETCRHEQSYFTGRNHFELYPHAENEAIFKRVVDTGESYFISAKPFEFPDQPERGTTYWDWSLIPTKDQEGRVEGLVFTLAEVTERVRTQETLRESEALLRIAGRTARFGGWSLNIADMRVVWSDEVALIHEKAPGYSPSVEAALQYYAPEWRERISKVLGDCIRDGAPYDEEMEIVTALGNRVWVRTTGEALRDETGAITRVQGACQDVTGHKRAEEALRASKELMSSAFDYAAIGMAFVSLTGRWLKVNASVTKLLGYTEEELYAKTFQDITHPDDLDTDLDYVRQLLAGEIPTYQMEKRYFHKNGGIVWVLLSVSLVRDPLGRPLHFISQIQDIGARKRAEEALHLKNFVFDVSIAANSIAGFDGIINEANESFLRIWGYSSKPEVIGKPIDHFLVDPKTGDAIVMELKEKGQWEGDYSAKRKDGTIFTAHGMATVLCDEQGRVIGYQSAVIDVTERKRAEDELRRSEARFRSYFELSLHGIAITSPEKGWIQVNKRISSILGYSRDEIVCMTWSEMTHPDDLAADVEQFERLLAGQIEQYEMEKRFIRKDGSIVWTSLAVGCVREPDGRVDYVIALLEDITGRKRAEEEKSRLEAQNLQLQKAESLGRMAGAIAHHFNNQLMVVMGNLELALSKMPAATGIHEFLSDAVEAARNASSVSRLMLTYLGQTPGKMEPMDISEVCRRGLPILQAMMPKHIVLDLQFPHQRIVVLADENQIQQVLSNLIANAWESIQGGPGVVRLAVRVVASSEISKINRYPINVQAASGEYACIEVTDNGCGIAAEDIDNLFDPFFSSKFTGRGLGLSVSLGIIRVHDGIITVDSILGHGSIFRVYLPKITEESSLRQHKVTQDPIIQGGGTVLLVEDDERVRKLTEKMLASLGMKVLVAADGVAALEIFKEQRGEIRCVLCDLTMPNMDGWATLTALRQIAPGIPVILASGYNEEYVMAGEHAELPQACLSKPYRREQLQAAIVRALSAENIL